MSQLLLLVNNKNQHYLKVILPHITAECSHVQTSKMSGYHGKGPTTVKIKIREQTYYFIIDFSDMLLFCVYTIFQFYYCVSRYSAIFPNLYGKGYLPTIALLFEGITFFAPDGNLTRVFFVSGL